MVCKVTMGHDHTQSEQDGALLNYSTLIMLIYPRNLQGLSGLTRASDFLAQYIQPSSPKISPTEI